MKSKHSIVASDCTARDALLALNENNISTLIIIDHQNRLLGTLTDGDLRRALINGLNFDDSILSAANTSPISFSTRDEADNFFKTSNSAQGILSIPIVSPTHDLIDVVDFCTIKPSKITALILAGGLGSRLRPLTLHTPKPMLEVGGQPIIQRIITQLRDSGIEDIFISVNYLKDQIIDYFGDGSDLDVHINYLHEDVPTGTAGSLLSLPTGIDQLLVINGDIRTELDFKLLSDSHLYSKSILTVAARLFSYDIPFGVLELDGDTITSLVEKPSRHYPVAAGIYMLNWSSILQYKEAIFTANGFLDMPDLITRLINQKLLISTFLIHEDWHDIGTVETYTRLYNKLKN